MTNDPEPPDLARTVIAAWRQTALPAADAAPPATLVRDLLAWLDAPDARTERRALEAAPRLLDPAFDLLLSQLARIGPSDPDLRRRIARRQRIAAEARARGGTVAAIRDAYIDRYGGLALDVPVWLGAAEVAFSAPHDATPEQALNALAAVRAALHRARTDPAVAPETRAALALLGWRGLAPARLGDDSGAIEAALVTLRDAAGGYDRARHPRRWAATQEALGVIYQRRRAGDHRENQDHALRYLRAALAARPSDGDALARATIQVNLGTLLADRAPNDAQQPLDEAIALLTAAQGALSPATAPDLWAGAQLALGTAWRKLPTGDRAANIEQALACYEAAGRIFTRDGAPQEWAALQSNRGIALRHRPTGDRAANIDQAIACFEAALQVVAQDHLPWRWAGMMNNLANAYMERPASDRAANLAQAVRCYRAALAVTALADHPEARRDTAINLALTEAERGNWAAAHDAFAVARQAEDALLLLSAEIDGRDALLRQGREANLRDGYALAQCGDLAAALLAVERGRARHLAAAQARNAADPQRIGDPDRRRRFLAARTALVAAHTALHAPPPDDDIPAAPRGDRFRQARAAFDAVIAEIRRHADPADFLDDEPDAALLARAANQAPGHALVYLVPTPWGGLALGVFAGPPPHTAALALPGMTAAFVEQLIEATLPDGTGRVIGGFGHAQADSALDVLAQQWPGPTPRASVEALRRACAAAGFAAPLDAAAQTLQRQPRLALLLNRPWDQLTPEERGTLAATLNARLFPPELARCLQYLGPVVSGPLYVWLTAQGARSLTLIPCGPLGALPLTAAPLADGRTLGMALPTSVAPSARALCHPERPPRPARLFALGNPHPTRRELRWGEAEALAVAELGRRAGLEAHVRVQSAASRDWLLRALREGRIVDVSCHGVFDLRATLQTRLLLANGQQLTLGDLLTLDLDLAGLRLLLLSACQTAMIDLRGARDEVWSLTTAVLQAGARAVLGTLWPVDDAATYLLMARFAQEWLPAQASEPPAAALGRAQQWLRAATVRDLRQWQAAIVAPEAVPVVGVASATRYDLEQALDQLQAQAQRNDPDARPYADPYYWGGFQVAGW